MTTSCSNALMALFFGKHTTNGGSVGPLGILPRYTYKRNEEIESRSLWWEMLLVQFLQICAHSSKSDCRYWRWEKWCRKETAKCNCLKVNWYIILLSAYPRKGTIIESIWITRNMSDIDVVAKRKGIYLQESTWNVVKRWLREKNTTCATPCPKLPTRVIWIFDKKNERILIINHRQWFVGGPNFAHMILFVSKYQ